MGKIKKGMRYLLVLFFTCFVVSVMGQNGAVLLQVQPSNAIVRLNGKEYKNLTRVEVPAGVYFVESWAPGREYLKDSLEVFADAFVKYDTILKVSPAFKVYSQEFSEYSKIKTGNGILKGSIVVFNAAITAIVMGYMPGDVKEHRNAANIALASYNSTTGAAGLAQFKEEYEREQQLYEEGKAKRKKYLVIALPSIAAMYGVSVFAWTRIRKAPPKPVLDAPNPFTTMDLRLVPEFGEGYTPTGMGFRFSMKF